MRVQEGAGGYRKVQESAGEYRRIKEGTGGLGGVQEGTGGCRRVQEGTGECRRVQKGTGGCRRVQEGAGGCRRVQEGAGGCRRGWVKVRRNLFKVKSTSIVSVLQYYNVYEKMREGLVIMSYTCMRKSFLIFDFTFEPFKFFFTVQ
jgi:hypothetical protein